MLTIHGDLASACLCSIKHGISSTTDLQFFNKARWNRFAQQRLAQDLPSAREFIVTDAVESYLDSLS